MKLSHIAKLIIESEDDKYVSIGYGRYKLKGKEKDDDADVFVKTDSGQYMKSDDQKSDDSGEKPEQPSANLGSGDFDRDANRAADDEADDMDRDARFAADADDDNAESDDVEISDANSGPIDRDDIMDMLKNDSEIMDKIGTGDDDDLYWDGLDLVSSKMDDQTVASIDPDSNMTLGDLKKQIMDFEYEEEDDPEKVSQFYGYDDEDMDETKIINGVKYKPVKESKQHTLKENYERFFGDKK